MNLGRFTEPRLLVPQLISGWRDSAIFELSQRLERTGRVESAITFTHAVLDHESLGSTASDEVAFPLSRGIVVKELSFALGFSSQGVRWGAGRVPLVHTVILFGIPLGEARAYDSLVLTMDRFLNDTKRFSALRRCTQPEEMWTVLNNVTDLRTDAGAAPAQS